MYYFGTSVSEYGHYFWTAEGWHLKHSKVGMNDLSFNPYKLLTAEQQLHKGEVGFFHSKKDDLFICAINGSCKDERGGTVTVFFTKTALTPLELVNQLKWPNTASSQIILVFPYPIKWPDLQTAEYQEI